MHEPSLTTREQTLLRDLTELLAMRAERHGALTESRDRATADADRRLRAATEQADAARAAAEARAAERAEADRAALDQRLSADARQAEAQFQRQALTLKERAANDEASLRKKLPDAVWLADAVYDTAKDKPRAEFDARKKDVDAHLAAASL
ncbi:MAG: hypothetical protein KIT68_10110, partial [Phycisphaeraceae bacterium]|nr:hypothetical protein [Phycisphaeraceae bacterium]